MPKKELATLIDQNDNVIGYKDKIDTHLWPTPLHRAISVMIYDGENILLQKRSTKKPIWPLYWSNAVCANVLKGETYEQCAKRRLWEEMGIKCDLNEALIFSYKKRYDKKYGEHELDHVFLGEYSGKVTLNPEEAVDYEWLTKRELIEDLKNNPEKYTPWFKIIVKKLLK